MRPPAAGAGGGGMLPGATGGGMLPSAAGGGMLPGGAACCCGW
jgi:hypothetical protein